MARPCASRAWPARICPLAPGIEDAAFVRFTSGTTGAAKGVVLTHRGVLERTRAANTGLRLTCEDRVLWVLPMAYHFYVSILLYLEAGAAVIVSADYLAESILDAAITHHATFLYVTPMHVRMLTGEPSKRALPPSLKRVMSVSSRLHPQAARDFQARYGIPVSQGYGIIEVGLPIMNIAEAAEHPEAIGRPLVAFEAAILDEASEAIGAQRNGTARPARPRHVRRLPQPATAPRRSAARGLVSHRRPRPPRQRGAHRAGRAHRPRSSMSPASRSFPRKSPACWTSTRQCCVRA